ncbi:hypothetical protein MNBD_BACTEROID06-990, partial [hydrothermal vent metagenome]
HHFQGFLNLPIKGVVGGDELFHFLYKINNY